MPWIIVCQENKWINLNGFILLFTIKYNHRIKATHYDTRDYKTNIKVEKNVSVDNSCLVKKRKLFCKNKLKPKPLIIVKGFDFSLFNF